MTFHGHEVSPCRGRGGDLFRELWTRKRRFWSHFLEEIKAIVTKIPTTYFSVTQPLHQRDRPETYTKRTELVPQEAYTPSRGHLTGTK